MRKVIAADMDETLVQGVVGGAIFYDVARYISRLARKTKLPVIIVTGRAAESEFTRRDTLEVLRDIRKETGWKPDGLLMRTNRYASLDVPGYKVAALKAHGLVPIIAIDDMPEVLLAYQKTFGTMPVLAQDGLVRKLRAA
jgi:hypothetical protein